MPWFLCSFKFQDSSCHIFEWDFGWMGTVKLQFLHSQNPEGSDQSFEAEYYCGEV